MLPRLGGVPLCCLERLCSGLHSSVLKSSRGRPSKTLVLFITGFWKSLKSTQAIHALFHTGKWDCSGFTKEQRPPCLGWKAAMYKPVTRKMMMSDCLVQTWCWRWSIFKGWWQSSARKKWKRPSLFDIQFRSKYIGKWWHPVAEWQCLLEWWNPNQKELLAGCQPSCTVVSLAQLYCMQGFYVVHVLRGNPNL